MIISIFLVPVISIHILKVERERDFVDSPTDLSTSDSDLLNILALLKDSFIMVSDFYRP